MFAYARRLTTLLFPRPMNFKPYAARVARGRLVSAEGGPVEGPNVLLVRHAHSVSNARGDWKTKQKKRRKEG